jgi:hypothetical protein
VQFRKSYSTILHKVSNTSIALQNSFYCFPVISSTCASKVLELRAAFCAISTNTVIILYIMQNISTDCHIFFLHYFLLKEVQAIAQYLIQLYCTFYVISRTRNKSPANHSSTVLFYIRIYCTPVSTLFSGSFLRHRYIFGPIFFPLFDTVSEYRK